MDTIVFTIVMLASIIAAFWLTIQAEHHDTGIGSAAIVTIRLVGTLIAIACACMSAWLVLNSLHPVH